jgi:hypothetical protein
MVVVVTGETNTGENNILIQWRFPLPKVLSNLEREHQWAMSGIKSVR